MLRASAKVKEAVNGEIRRRIKDKYHGRKLNYQSPDEWAPNCSFVNCYDGGKERYPYQRPHDLANVVKRWLSCRSVDLSRSSRDNRKPVARGSTRIPSPTGYSKGRRRGFAPAAEPGRFGGPDLNPPTPQLAPGDACRNARRMEAFNSCRPGCRFASDRGKQEDKYHLQMLQRTPASQLYAQMQMPDSLRLEMCHAEEG